jgi:hypothetical protein
MERLLIALGLLGGLALLACSTVQVDYDYDPSVEFGGLRTYAWLPGPAPSAGRDPRLQSPLLDARIRRSIDFHLAEAGYQKVQDEAPDFQVAYYVGIESKVDVDTIYHGYGRVGWAGSGWADTVVREYEQGTLLIDFLDPMDGELMWRGTGQTRLSDRGELTPEKRDALVDEVVAAILAGFPPGPKK